MHKLTIVLVILFLSACKDIGGIESSKIDDASERREEQSELIDTYSEEIEWLLAKVEQLQSDQSASANQEAGISIEDITRLASELVVNEQALLDIQQALSDLEALITESETEFDEDEYLAELFQEQRTSYENLLSEFETIESLVLSLKAGLENLKEAQLELADKVVESQGILASLKSAADTITLIPGEKGDAGDIGEDGSQGATGPAGSAEMSAEISVLRAEIELKNYATNEIYDHLSSSFDTWDEYFDYTDVEMRTHQARLQKLLNLIEQVEVGTSEYNKELP